jgi:S1-C subfamily serine protease
MLRFILLLTFTFGSVLTAFAQQPSIIDQMIRIKPSLVEVMANNAAATLNSPKQKSLFKDPHTGKIVMLERGVTLASYQRNGAGVIIDPSGVIVTNAHTINQAERVEVLLADGTKLNAKIIRFAKDLDLAFLKIEVATPLPTVTIADSSQILLNQEIFTVGSSPLLKESISGGKITGLASSRNASYSNDYESDFFQTSMNIYKGDSGGPLFNRAGQLIGLMTAKLLSKDNSSYAISSNKIRRYLDAYLKEQSISK